MGAGPTGRGAAVAAGRGAPLGALAPRGVRAAAGRANTGRAGRGGARGGSSSSGGKLSRGAAGAQGKRKLDNSAAHPSKKRNTEHAQWGAQPIAQQPLHFAGGAGDDEWYQDSYSGQQW